MQCPVCPSADFTPSEYRTNTFSVPALECARCGALMLDEGSARTLEERRAIRDAIAIRDGIARRQT